MHVIKVGSLYLTAEGGLSPQQTDAVRLLLSVDDRRNGPRFVKLRPKTAPTVDTLPDPPDTPSTDSAF